MAHNLIIEALRPVPTTAWGDLAIGRLGVPTVICVCNSRGAEFV